MPHCLRHLLTVITVVSIAACDPSGPGDARVTPVQQVSPPVAVDLALADAEIAANLASLLAAARAEPQNADARGALAMAYEVNGFADAALQSYVEARLLDPADSRWPHLQALLVAHSGELDKALALMDTSLALEPGSRAAMLWRANWLLDLDRVADASRAFAEAAANGAGLPATAGRVRVMLREGKPAEALRSLGDANDPDHPYLRKLAGQAYARLGQVDAAREALEGVAGMGPPGWPDAHTEAKKAYSASLGSRLAEARRLMEESQFTSALAALELLGEAHPDHQGLLGLLAETYRRAGNSGKARDVIARGLQAHPDYYAFHLAMAEHLIAARELAPALTHLERAIELHPGVAWAHGQRGLILIERQRAEDALVAFQQALSIEPGNATVGYYAGMVEAARQRWPQAISYLATAVRNDVTLLPAHVALSRSLIEAGQFDQADDALAAALRAGADPSEVASAKAMLERRRVSR